MSTIQTVVTRMRVRLEEATERKWSDADQLIPYASEAERWWARYFSRLPKSRRFRYREDITLPANTEAFDLTTLTKKFDWLIWAAVKVSNLWVPIAQFQDDDEYAQINLAVGGGFVVPRLNMQDTSLLFDPTFTQARTIRLKYGWVPAIKSSASDSLDIPDEYLLDVVNRALWFALSDAGQTNTSFEEQGAVRLAEIEDLERSRLGISNESVVRRSRTFARCR